MSITNKTEQCTTSNLQKCTFTGILTSNSPAPTSASSVPTISWQSTSSISTAVSSIQSSACNGGTGEGNYPGLCEFSCQYGYCPGPPPSGPCTCTAVGAVETTPPTVTNNGVPLPEEDQSYEGLCSYACAHGYCPPSACVAT